MSAFRPFLDNFHSTPGAALGHFYLLYDRNSTRTQTVTKLLLNNTPGTRPSALLTNLRLLNGLSAQTTLRHFGKPRLRLFTKLSTLIPIRTTDSILTLLPSIRINLVRRTYRTFLLRTPRRLTTTVRTFLRRSNSR